MKTASRILADLYTSQELTTLINKMDPPELREDLKQELFVILCEKQAAEIERIEEAGQLKFYVTRIVLNMIASSTSPFYKKYRSTRFTKVFNDRHGDAVDDVNLFGDETIKQRSTYFGINDKLIFDADDPETKEYEYQALVDAVNAALEKLPHYDREIFKDYVAKGSAGKMIKEMKELTGNYIPKRSILKTVKNVKEKIKKEVKRA